MKDIVEDEGLTSLTPKTVLCEAFAVGMIEKDELWFAMLSDRNTTAIFTVNNWQSKDVAKLLKNMPVNSMN